ncbi:NACHT domain-containing protein [Streptomyces sp. NPDC004732]|uniref:NACHT domain-containing protein n=1 Tax=Streptomyces sp. NPDC004732 TaxID=3154290 RepID=UPI0033ACC60B
MGARQVRGPARWLFVSGAATLLASGVWAVWSMRLGGMQPQDVAGVLGLPLGVLGLLVGAAISLSALRLQRASDGLGVALDRLAGSVEDVEVAERTHMLGTGAHLIDLHVDVEPRGGGAALRGRQRLSDVARWYCAAPGRLVVTGPAGAGKTVLAVHLVVSLLEARAPGSPVPVRLSIRDLPPVGGRRWWGLRRARGGLEQWLVSSLVKSYDVDSAAAAELVARRLVIPVLDGLDEMDTEVGEDDEDDQDDSCHARQALGELNGYQGLGGSSPLVLTCRAQRYAELAYQQAWLREATLLRIAGVDADQADAYVQLRSDGRPSPMDAVADVMRGSAAGPVAGLLSSPFYLGLAFAVYGEGVGALRPLVDFRTEDELREYLLARCVPTATAAANAAAQRARASLVGARSVRSRQAEYEAGAVHRWLHHMAGPEGRIASIGDVVGKWSTLALSMATGLALVAAVLLVVPDVLARCFPDEWWEHREGTASSVLLAGLVTLGAGVGWMSILRDREPSRLSERARQRPARVSERMAGATRRACRTACGVLVPTAAVVLDALFVYGDWYREIPGLGWYVLGVVTGVALPAVLALNDDFVAYTDRRELAGCVVLPAFGYPVGLVLAETGSLAVFVCGAVLTGTGVLLWSLGFVRGYSLAGGAFTCLYVSDPRALGLDGRFPAGCLVGFVAAYVLGCVLLGSERAAQTRQAVRHAGRRVEWLLPLGSFVLLTLAGVAAVAQLGFAGVVYLALALATLRLIGPLIYALLILTAHLRGRMPLTPDAFLAWAYHAGLLRIVGGAYQFRHSELQEWLDRNPSPPNR